MVWFFVMSPSTALLPAPAVSYRILIVCVCWARFPFPFLFLVLCPYFRRRERTTENDWTKRSTVLRGWRKVFGWT